MIDFIVMVDTSSEMGIHNLADDDLKVIFLQFFWTEEVELSGKYGY